MMRKVTLSAVYDDRNSILFTNHLGFQQEIIHFPQYVFVRESTEIEFTGLSTYRGAVIFPTDNNF